MTMNPRDAATTKGCINSMISLSQKSGAYAGFPPG